MDCNPKLTVGFAGVVPAVVRRGCKLSASFGQGLVQTRGTYKAWELVRIATSTHRIATMKWS